MGLGRARQGDFPPIHYPPTNLEPQTGTGPGNCRLLSFLRNSPPPTLRYRGNLTSLPYLSLQCQQHSCVQPSQSVSECPRNRRDALNAVSPRLGHLAHYNRPSGAWSSLFCYREALLSDTSESWLCWSRSIPGLFSLCTVLKLPGKVFTAGNIA